MNPMIALALLAALLLCSGCETPKEKEEAQLKAVVTIHSYSTEPQDRMDQGVQISRGRYIYPDPVPLLSSADIMRVETYDVPGGKGLRLYLDSRGASRWTVACGQHRGGYLVLMIDGGFRSLLKLDEAIGSSVIDLPGPFTSTEARELADNAVANYEIGKQ